MEPRITAQDTSYAKRLCDALNSAPQDKRTIMAVMAETFISGMKTQERLTNLALTRAIRETTAAR